MTASLLKKQIRQLGYELMLAEVTESYCEEFIEKRKLHDSLLEKLYKLEKRVF